MSLATPERARRALLVAATLLAGVARAGEPPPAGGGALRVSAEPARLVLGRQDAVELRVAAPADIQELTVTASAGRVEDLRRLPGDGFAARFRPPAERVPQVAIVSAVGRTARGLEDGWIAIPLSGEGDARVRGKPGTAITLRIADRTFGPQTAGPDGVAVIPVVVPPGVREAHQGFRPIDLRVPEKPLLHAVQDRTEIRADREEKVHVLAYVVAPHGAARRGDVPAFEPSRGIVAVSEREPGAFQATWTVPPGPAGEERLSIRLPSAPASRGVLKVQAAPGPPAVVAVAFDRSALVAGGEAAVVTARALDAGGNVVPAELVLEARGARISDVRERRPGELVARVQPGRALGADHVVVTAIADAAGISGSRALPLRPGEAATARFQSGGAVVRSDGAREAVLRLSVADQYGNAVSAVPTVSAARGRVLEISERGRGEYAVRYVGPAVDEAVPDEIVARVGALRATAAPVLAPPGPALLASAHGGIAFDLRGRFAGPAAGVVAQRPADVAYAVRRGAEVAWRLEADLLRGGVGAVATLLAGAGVRRPIAGAELEAAASAGLVLSPEGSSPGARLAVSLGLPRRWGVPFAGASLLGAGAGAPGAFAAVGLFAGVRFGLESTDGHDPHRR